ncbi:UNVERIFIED_CONTAM: hypothetical protein GTU68_034033 [Idotea baltica]|nr:hypothetical protein [Idotea baltica]
MVAIFTHHDHKAREAGAETYETQSIAFSNDRGRTWTKYSENPVVQNPGLKDFRDPKVIWHEESAQWVMVVAADDRVHFYQSSDLRSWVFASEFGSNAGNHDGTWECPDLFPLQVKGTKKWVLIQNVNPGHPNGGSGAQYFVGDFDGSHFSNDNTPSTTLWVDYGKDNYASVTWSDIPSDDGRRISIGWMSNWQYAQKVPSERWRSAMTLPRELRLIESSVGYRLTSVPVGTVTSIRQEAVALGRGDLSGKYPLLRNIKKKNGLYEVQLEFVKPDSGRVQVECYNAVGDLLYVGYDVDQNEYYIDRISAGRSDFDKRFAGRHTAPCYYDSETVKMRMFFDVSSVELFADDGKTVMSEIFFPDPPFTDMNVSSDQQPLKMKRGRVFELNSIW